jgi:hypothetical protein
MNNSEKQFLAKMAIQNSQVFRDAIKNNLVRNKPVNTA